MRHIFENGKIPSIIILSRSKAARFTCDVPWACIQIGDADGDWPKINKVQLVDSIRLHFLDVEEKVDWLDENMRKSDEFIKSGFLFNEEHAQKIWAFVEKNIDCVEHFMIHCFAGISRSAAVGAAIAKIYNGNSETFFQYHYPNKLVYATLLEVKNK